MKEQLEILKRRLAQMEWFYQRVLDHGTAIIATGGKEYRGKAYLFGEDSRVITQEEFEKRKFLFRDPSLSKAKSIVMIQCVGPWDEDPAKIFVLQPDLLQCSGQECYQNKRASSGSFRSLSFIKI